MEKAIRILEDAAKSLKIEIRIWTKQGDMDIVEKCRDELRQCEDAIGKLSGGGPDDLKNGYGNKRTFEIGQVVRCNIFSGFYYVKGAKDDKILIATRKDIRDEGYSDYWVNVEYVCY